MRKDEQRMKSKMKKQSEKLSKKMTAIIVALMAVVACLGTGISVEAKPKDMLKTPQITNCYNDGDSIYLEWEKVDQAQSYEVYWTDTASGKIKNDKTSGIWCYVPVNDRGTDYSIEVYAVNGKAVSDGAAVSIYVPEINYKDVSYAEASCLSLNQLKKWADYQGVEWEIYKEDGYTYLEIHEKDPNNSGMNKKNAQGYAGYAWDGAMKNVDEKLDSEYGLSKFGSFLSKWLDEDKDFGDALSETLDETLDDIGEATMEGAFEGMADRFIEDKDIYYIYYYDSDMVQCAAIGAWVSRLKYNNDAYIKSIQNNFEKVTADGGGTIYCTYLASEDVGRYIYIGRWNRMMPMADG